MTNCSGDSAPSVCVTVREPNRRGGAVTQEVPGLEALKIVIGYCLGEEDVHWQKPHDGVDIAPTRPVRGAFAFRTYDCVPGSDEPELTDLDVLVCDGLNGQMRSKDLAGVLSVAKDVGVHIAALDNGGMTFWSFDSAELTSKPERGSRAWALWAAWTLLMGVEGVDVARAHKILHHKRPKLFPLIDNKTLPSLAPHAWSRIHKDLTECSEGWTWLEARVDERLSHDVDTKVHESTDPRVSRLRLHDILLWCKATKRWTIALELGEQILSQKR